MIKIVVDNYGECETKAHGMTLALMAELGVGVESLVKGMIVECPEGIKEKVKGLIMETLTFAVNEAFK